MSCSTPCTAPGLVVVIGGAFLAPVRLLAVLEVHGQLEDDLPRAGLKGRDFVI